MAQSLPAQTTSPAGSTVKPSARDAVLNAAAGVTLRTMPRIPDRLKRLFMGGRSVTVDGNTLDTVLQLMLTAEHASGVGKLVASENVAIARRQASILAAELPHVDIDVAETDLSIPGPAGEMRARHYRPDEAEAPMLVFYHGGGFVIGGIDTHDNLCQLICRDAGVHVLSVDYRLAPEHKAPAAADDAFAAYRWALEHAAELGADPHRVAVGGDSAGGNLAAVVSQRARDEGVRLPALQLLLYPVTNHANDTRSRNLFADGYWLTKRNMDWFTENYLGGSGLDPADPRVSPLLSDDLSGLPPALVLTGGFDPLRDEGNQYADALRAAGNAVDARQFGSLIHGFANFIALGGGSATAIAEMASALRAHLSRG
ncbi:MAG: alpha/beta hydrolase [Mycobacterium sp.]